MLHLSLRRIPAPLGLPLAAVCALVFALLSGGPALLAASPLDGLTGSNPASAAPSADADAAFTLEAVTARRAALQIETARARARLEKLPASPGETSAEADALALSLTQELGLLACLDGVFAEQLRTLQHAADLAAESAALAVRAQSPRPPEERLPPPRGLARLDELYAERDYLVRAETLLATDLENAAAALDDARDELKASDRLRRSAKDPRATSPAPALHLAELESRLGREAVRLAENALATLRLQQSLLAPKLALLLPDVAWLHAHLVLADDDLATRQTGTDKRLAELDDIIAETRDEAERVARLVVAAERRATANPAPASDASVDDELESRRADRQTINLTLNALAALRERAATFTEVDDLRRRVHSQAGGSADFKIWAAANREALERLPQDRRIRLRELRKSRRELQDLRARLAAPDKPGADRAPPWIADRARHLSAWIETNERDLADLADLATVRQHLAEELGHRVFTFSLPDTLRAGWTRVVSAWDYEVFSVADQPVRVRTILTAIVLLLAGHWLSRRLSALIGRTVFRRLGMNTGHRAAWQTLSFYALFLVVLLTATNLFHLSLTQFSVVSGALAVGIGFGSQTLISNFISGIILLLERPVNQGDVIEIDGQQLTVEHVGPRSTLVRSYDNAQIIVPNSRLLEENVINWTLSDDVVRTRINVGVAYGSPTREVARLLEEVLLGLEDVRREPAPLVTFIDFGESALSFQASFWSSLQGRKELESELRHRIAEAFVTAGIVMAFPQRDVHLETTKPLRVELTTAPAITSAPPKE